MADQKTLFDAWWNSAEADEFRKVFDDKVRDDCTADWLFPLWLAATSRPVSGAWVDEAREILNETYGFYTSSRRAQDNINAVLELIDKHASDVTEPKP